MSEEPREIIARADGHPRSEELVLVPVTLVPVEVFGTDDCCAHGPGETCRSKGYGLSDAVEAWSDCNRAIGRIYRVEDLPDSDKYRRPGDTVTVYVAASDVEWFQRRFGDDQ